MGAYFVLSSIYCLLAYLPYTYIDVVKAPPYAWIVWFARWQALLYWPTLLAGGVFGWKRFNKGWHRCIPVALIILGVYCTIRPSMPNVQPDTTTYAWSLLWLLPLAILSVSDIVSNQRCSPREEGVHTLFEYSTAIKIGVLVSLLFTCNVIFRGFVSDHSPGSSRFAYDSELAAWSLISHVTLAMVVLSVLNLIRIATAEKARRWRLLLLEGCVAAFLWWGLERFLNNGLSFGGWFAQTYAAFLALTLVLFGTSIGLPMPRVLTVMCARRGGRILLSLICIGMTAIGLVFPSIVGGADWNGMLQTSFTFLLWLFLAVSSYAFWTKRGSYSLPTVLGVLILTIFGYKALQATEIFWAKPLGLTDDSISRTLDLYATRDTSFALAHRFLFSGRDNERCGDLCRIMRQYANIRNPIVKNDVTLVEHFEPNDKQRPNIFIFVIDSLRPDYLGAYNPKVDFTPNLDKFAEDSVVLRNAYTQYAGTSLSEPAIWAGTMLLHSHYQQPFQKLNNLARLAQGDGYRMIVSWDEILRQIMSPPPAGLIRLDTDKPLWNNLEACSTIDQLENVLDHSPDRSRPIFFYTQPKNVHQFAKNNVPSITSANWRTRPGFKNRIAYELNHADGCLGRFFDYLRARNLYDNSVIILTSDHGDATGELGRSSHSIIVYPEVMRVPLIIHLPEEMKKDVLYDADRITTLTDITPSLYYLLGHRPILHNPMFGRPLFAQTEEELKSYGRNDVFFASDVRAVFGLLEDHGRFFYAAYDSPAQSMLFDLAADPQGTKNILTEDLKKQYDQKIIEHLQAIGDFYGYKPGIGSLLASKK
jgi:arylsulfatase A-like enzyme